MATMQVTDTAAVGMDLVSSYVQAYLFQNAVLLPSVLDRTPDVKKGDKSVSYGRRSALTAATKVAGTPYSAQTLTWSADKLALDKQEGVLVNLEEIADLQSILEQEPQIMEAAAEALATKLEANLYTALAATSSSAPDHKIAFGTADKLALADILAARLLLDKQNAPETDRFLAINPDQFTNLLALEAFIDASKYGSNVALINGEIGQIYGFRVLKTNNVTASTALAYHRTHVAFARQMAVTWKTQDDLDNASVKYLMQTVYGLKTLDSGKRGVLLNNTGA